MEDFLYDRYSIKAELEELSSKMTMLYKFIYDKDSIFSKQCEFKKRLLTMQLSSLSTLVSILQMQLIDLEQKKD